MLLNNGKELLFWIDSLPCDKKSGIYLTYIDNDSKGMKFTGGIPFLWELDEDSIQGPNLYDEDDVYRVVDIDYCNNNIWIEKI